MYITVYTDGSYNPAKNTGAWAALILQGSQKNILHEIVQHSTHNRMELMAVIKAIEYIQQHYQNPIIQIYSDSQYVVNLENRRAKMEQNQFLTKQGNIIVNADLVTHFFLLIRKSSVQFIKVKAHQKKTDQINYNREVDILVRKLLRQV